MTESAVMTKEQLSISINCQRRASHALHLIKTKQKTEWQLRQEIAVMPEGFEKDEFRRWLNHYRHIITPPPEQVKEKKPLWSKSPNRYGGRSRS